MNLILTLIWKPKRPLILLLLAGLASTGCGASSQAQSLPPATVNMTLEVDPNPPAVGPSHLTVMLSEEDGTLLEVADLTITGTMAHDGMQPRFAKAKTTAAGTYESPFVWPMAGDWTLTLDVTLPDGRVAERQFDVNVADEMAMEAAGQDHKSHAHPERIPNQGAVIRLVDPEDGAIFRQGEDIQVEIEYENFDLGEEGQHWHIYVNDQPGQMIMGKTTDAVLRDLEPGQYQISTYLAATSHTELEEGAMVTIRVIGADGETGR